MTKVSGLLYLKFYVVKIKQSYSFVGEIMCSKLNDRFPDLYTLTLAPWTKYQELAQCKNIQSWWILPR